MMKKNALIDKTSLVFLLTSTAALARRYRAQNKINDKEGSDKKLKTPHHPGKNNK